MSLCTNNLNDAKLDICEAEARLSDDGGSGAAGRIAGYQIASQSIERAIQRLKTVKKQIEEQLFSNPKKG
jgi:hypothetical protein